MGMPQSVFAATDATCSFTENRVATFAMPSSACWHKIYLSYQLATKVLALGRYIIWISYSAVDVALEVQRLTPLKAELGSGLFVCLASLNRR